MHARTPPPAHAARHMHPVMHSPFLCTAPIYVFTSHSALVCLRLGLSRPWLRFTGEARCPDTPIPLACGACAVEEHYTPELAQIVTTWAKRDLETFGYPEWDGRLSTPWY
eukprot:5877914-Prymnesium_polylepis.2